MHCIIQYYIIIEYPKMSYNTRKIWNQWHTTSGKPHVNYTDIVYNVICIFSTILRGGSVFLRIINLVRMD